MSALSVAIVLALAAAAHAAPRVEIADPDPELVHAVETALAPWKLDIAVVRSAPADDADARARAPAEGAQFIVWREGGTLVVYDRARDATERRPARIGAFDPATAAAAAATIKTMMRLPAQPDSTARLAPMSPAGSSHSELRFDAGPGARFSAGGSDTAPSARLIVSGMIRPKSHLPLWFGARGDLGTDASIDRSGFSGTWGDWSVIATGCYALVHGPWELEETIGIGVTRGTLDGKQMADARTETATLPAVFGGTTLRYRWGAFSAGGGVAATITPAPPTYTKETPGMGAPEVFEAPRMSVVIAGLIAIDLGR